MTFICTKETPWSPSIPGEVQHSDAREVGNQIDGWPGGDIITFECPNCGYLWEVELPQ